MQADQAENSLAANPAYRSRPVESVSVVTVCRNAADTIGVTLDSVAAQTHPTIEHLVVDGASTDTTVEQVRARPGATLISEPDNGIYDAMDKGARLARGDALFFLNSGDVFHDETVIQDVVEFFNAQDCDAVFGNLLPRYLRPGDTHDHQAFQADRVMDFAYFCNRRLFFDESIHHQTTFYRREIFERCQFECADPQATGEYHLNVCAFIRHEFALRHIPRTICRFALGGTSTSDFNLEWQRFASARAALRQKYFPRGRRVPFAGPYEYLTTPPSASLRLKIMLRGSFLHWPLGRLRKMSRSFLTH